MASLIGKVDSEFDRQVVPAGNAVAANVDNGKTFINSTGQLVTGTSNKVSPAGTAVAANVLSGKTFINSTGQTITGTMANRGGAQFITPGTSNKTLNAGYYNGNITVEGDSNLVADNIVSGKSIFGVEGTALSIYSGTWDSISLGAAGTWNKSNWIYFSNSSVGGDLSFTPSRIMVYFEGYGLIDSMLHNSEDSYATLATDFQKGSYGTTSTVLTGTGILRLYFYEINSRYIRLGTQTGSAGDSGSISKAKAYFYIFY
jgi:hypothetical protein